MSLRRVSLCLLLPAVLCPQPPTGAIRGTVVDELKSIPLHTANIELRGEGIRRLVQATGGEFRITGLPPGVYDLTITGSFLVPTTIRSVALKPAEIRGLPPIQVASSLIDCGAGTLRFFHPLDHPEPGKGTLAGAVVDEQQHPLAGVRVRVGSLGQAAGQAAGQATTDEEGRFSIDNVPAGGRYEIEIAREGYYTETYSDFQVQAGYEAVNGGLNLAACGHDRCDPALRPVRLVRACA